LAACQRIEGVQRTLEHVAQTTLFIPQFCLDGLCRPHEIQQLIIAPLLPGAVLVPLLVQGRNAMHLVEQR
jgi:hypothetical protein